MNPANVGDPTLTFDQDFLLDSGSTMAQAAKKGPTLNFTRAGNARAFDSAGLLSNVTENNPRFAHDPAGSNAQLGLLEEPAATNLQINSQAFDNAAWSKTNITIGADDRAAPDGTTTADLFTDNTNDTDHSVREGLSLSAGVNFAISIYARAGTKDFIYLSVASTVDENHITAVFDISSGSTETGATETDVGSISGTILITGQIDVGDGWFCCFMVGQTDDTSVNLRVGLAAAATGNTFNAGGVLTYLGTTQNAHLWGIQVELGDSPTSYIPTTTGTVTRAKDVRTTTDLTWLNASAGTMFKQGIIPHVSAAERTLWSIDDGTATDRLRLYLDAAENGNFETVNSGDTDGASDGAAVIAVNTVFKLAGTYEDDSVIGYVDGTASTEDTSAGIPVTDAATISRWGDDSAAGTPFNGFTQKEKYFNEVKDAAFMAAL